MLYIYYLLIKGEKLLRQTNILPYIRIFPIFLLYFQHLLHYTFPPCPDKPTCTLFTAQFSKYGVLIFTT